MTKNTREKQIVNVTLIGSAGNLFLVIFKFIAGVIGHSSAMIADAVHSLSDFATDIVVLFFIHISSKPKDEGHDYGHGKFETLATAIIGIALLIVGFGLLWEGGSKIYGYYFKGIELESPGLIAFIAALVSILVKEILFRYTLHVGKKQNSQAVIANAWHHRSDAFSSIATALGIGGAILLGSKWRVLDPIAAVFVSALIIKVAFSLLLPALNDLLEKSLPRSTEDEILQIVSQNDEIKDPHNLRTRSIGNEIAIELHVRVKGNMTVYQAHKLTLEIEQNLRGRFGAETHIALHVEPEV